MRIVLVDDDEGQVKIIKGAVQRADINLSDPDCIYLPHCTKTEVQRSLLERLQTCPTPSLLLAHTSAFAETQQDALAWLAAKTSPSTLVLAYSGDFRGVSQEPAFSHLWTVGDSLLQSNLSCFLITSQPYWCQGWPDKVPVELLRCCDWEVLALKHLAAVGNELAAIADLPKSAQRLEEMRKDLAERFGEFRQARAHLQGLQASATTIQDRAISNLVAALTHPDPCASADAWEYAMDEFGEQLAKQPAQARCWVADLLGALQP